MTSPLLKPDFSAGKPGNTSRIIAPSLFFMPKTEAVASLILSPRITPIHPRTKLGSRHESGFQHWIRAISLQDPDRTLQTIRRSHFPERYGRAISRLERGRVARSNTRIRKWVSIYQGHPAKSPRLEFRQRTFQVQPRAQCLDRRSAMSHE